MSYGILGYSPRQLDSQHPMIPAALTLPSSIAPRQIGNLSQPPHSALRESNMTIDVESQLESDGTDDEEIDVLSLSAEKDIWRPS